MRSPRSRPSLERGSRIPPVIPSALSLAWSSPSPGNSSWPMRIGRANCPDPRSTSRWNAWGSVLATAAPILLMETTSSLLPSGFTRQATPAGAWATWSNPSIARVRNSSGEIPRLAAWPNWLRTPSIDGSGRWDSTIESPSHPGRRQSPSRWAGASRGAWWVQVYLWPGELPSGSCTRCRTMTSGCAAGVASALPRSTEPFGESAHWAAAGMGTGLA